MEAIRQYPREVEIVNIGIPVAIACLVWMWLLRLVRDKIDIDNYLENNRFNIPESFQIPLTTEMSDSKEDDFANPLTATLNEEGHLPEFEFEECKEMEGIIVSNFKWRRCSAPQRRSGSCETQIHSRGKEAA